MFREIEKFYLYSAHDSTIVCLLSNLLYKEKVGQPPYAGSISFLSNNWWF